MRSQYVFKSAPSYTFLLLGCLFPFVYYFKSYSIAIGSGNTEEVEQLDFGSNGNSILGAGYSADGQPLFFSVLYGMITIQPSHQPQMNKSK